MTIPLRHRLFWSVVGGAIIFAIDWSGFDRMNVDLFVPKAFEEMWWHFPAWVAAIFVAMTFYRDPDDDGPRGLEL